VARSLKFVVAITVLLGVLSLGFLEGRTLRRTATPIGAAQLRAGRFTLSASARSGDAPAGAGDASDTQDTGVAPADIFETVLDHVRRDYVDPTGPDSKLTEGALSRMFSSLDDPKTVYLAPALRAARQQELGGDFHGIGAALTMVQQKKDGVDYRLLEVVDAMPGSPAEKAGLKPGDSITDIDSHWVITYSPLVDIEKIQKEKTSDVEKEKAFQNISNRFKSGYSPIKAMTVLVTGNGAQVQLTVDRPGVPAPIKVTLTTAETRVDPVEFKMVGKAIGYLHVHQFNTHATEKFQQALASAGALKGLILDLRANPGGESADPHSGINAYESAIALLGRLTHGMVGQIARHPKVMQPVMITGDKPTHVPVVVLVDQGTANIAEFVAAAMHARSRARIVGTKTFGDSVLQLFTAFKSGAGVELATAHLLDAQGADLHEGVRPDVAISAGSGDAALNRALQLVQSGA
jgi:carboxyl-terminal processing protease